MKVKVKVKVKEAKEKLIEKIVENKHYLKESFMVQSAKQGLSKLSFTELESLNLIIKMK